MALRNYMLFVFIFWAWLGYAQNLVITGSVVDANGKFALPQVNINIIGRNSSTVTDDDGVFSFSLPSNIKKGDIIRLKLSKEGYKILDRQIVASSELPIIFKLTKINIAISSTKTNGIIKEVNNKKDNNEASTKLTNDYDLVLSYFGNNYRVKKGLLWGIVNSKGKIIQPVKFLNIEALNNGVSLFTFEQILNDDKDKQKYMGGFDEHGNMIIEPKYSSMIIHCGVITVVRFSPLSHLYTCGVLSMKGQELFNFDIRHYTSISYDCCKEMTLVQLGHSDDKWGALDKKGNVVYECKYTEAALKKIIGCE